MRAHGLDTYYGEGPLLADHHHFDFVYTKVSHGSWNIIKSNSSAGKITENIFKEMKKYEIRGAYAYLLSDNQSFHWRTQANAYLDAVAYIEDELDIPIHFDVLDIESKHNLVWRNSFNMNTYPRQFGSMIYETAKYIQEKRQRPLLLYMNESTWKECFTWNGYSFHVNYPLLIANYPFKHWDKSLEDITSNLDKQPRLPEGVTDWKIWQYSEKYHAGAFFPDSKEADVNVFNGTVDEMRDWLELPKRGQKRSPIKKKGGLLDEQNL